MSKVHLVIPDQHATPEANNERADWIGKLILDLRPDVVVQMGDAADMASLSSYDKGRRVFAGRNYRADIESHLDFQERMWAPIKRAKRKLPHKVALIGNHEQRIDRALDLSPELAGTIGYRDLDLERYYNEVVHYDGDTPGVIELDGVSYAHYFITGVKGLAVSGEHPAYTMLSKNFQSCTQGHTHIFDYCTRTRADGKRIQGLVCGVYQDYTNAWAGERGKLWWRGVIIKRAVEDGTYDLEQLSLNELKRIYSDMPEESLDHVW